MQKKGFTLLEILLVIVILVVVSLFAVPAYKKSIARSKYNSALGTLVQFGTALQMLKQDTGVSWQMDPVRFVPSTWFTDTNVSEAEQLDKNEINDINPAMFKAALVAHGYMIKPLSLDSTYDFYMCNLNGDPEFCCQEDTLACMQLPAGTCVEGTNEEFAGALFKRDGSYSRIKNCIE